MMIEVDKLRGIKSATVAIGLSNKDTNEVTDSFGTGFFIGGKYIVGSAHVFSQCLNYNTIYKEKNNGLEGMYSAFSITISEDLLDLNTHRIDESIRLPPVKVAGFRGSIDLDIGVGKLDRPSDNFLTIKWQSTLHGKRVPRTLTLTYRQSSSR